MARKSKRGFTLIELLVVIAIIAILAAILFPVFVSAKEAGKQSACKGNLKQLGSALQMYVDDSGGRMPFMPVNYIRDAMAPSAEPNYAKQLFKYAKNKTIFCCPSATPFPPTDANFGTLGPTIYSRISYYTNGITDGKKISACKHASKTAFMREGKVVANCAYERPVPTGEYVMAGNVAARENMNQHNNGANYLFVDSHVRHVRLDQTPDDPNHPFWNFDGGSYRKYNP